MRGRRRLSTPERPVFVSRRVRGSCNLLAVILFGYALLERDFSVAMLTVALLTGLVASSSGLGNTSFARALKQALYAFSLTLFIGAFLLMVLSGG